MRTGYWSVNLLRDESWRAAHAWQLTDPESKRSAKRMSRFLLSIVQTRVHTSRTQVRAADAGPAITTRWADSFLTFRSDHFNVLAMTAITYSPAGRARSGEVP
jgi:hypothetical protein